MAFDVACSCGNVLHVTDDMAGSAIACRCGRKLNIPPLRELQHLADRSARQARLRARIAEFHRNLLELTPRVVVGPALVGLNVLVFAAMAASGVSFMNPRGTDLLRWGANFGPLTISGEWWRLLTCTFIHIGLLHLLLNMWAVWVAGPLVERMVGNLGFLILYLVSGLCGSVTSLGWNPHIISAGASGAVFGIFGGLLGLLLRQRGSVPPQALRELRTTGVAVLVCNLAFGLIEKQIDSAAHLGGLAGGFLLGVVLGQPLTPAARADRPIRNVLAGGLGVALVLAGAVAVYLRYAPVVKG